MYAAAILGNNSNPVKLEPLIKKKEEKKNSTNKSKCYLAILWCEWLDLSKMTTGHRGLRLNKIRGKDCEERERC